MYAYQKLALDVAPWVGHRPRNSKRHDHQQMPVEAEWTWWNRKCRRGEEDRDLGDPEQEPNEWQQARQDHNLGAVEPVVIEMWTVMQNSACVPSSGKFPRWQKRERERPRSQRFENAQEGKWEKHWCQCVGIESQRIDMMKWRQWQWQAMRARMDEGKGEWWGQGQAMRVRASNEGEGKQWGREWMRARARRQRQETRWGEQKRWSRRSRLANCYTVGDSVAGS